MLKLGHFVRTPPNLICLGGRIDELSCSAADVNCPKICYKEIKGRN